MNLSGNRTDVVTQSSRRVLDEPHDFQIQWGAPQPLSAPARDLQTSQRPFLDQCPLELGDCHEHAKLKLPDRILLRGVDPLAGADQGHVAHWQLANDNGEVSEAAAQAVELVSHDLMDPTGPDLSEHIFKPRASRSRPRRGIPEYLG